MNRTIIILNFIITSSFTKPIDEFSKDDVDVKEMESKTLSFYNDDDDDISSFVNIDDLISNSEINKLYESKRLDPYIRRLKEPELDEAFEKTKVNMRSRTRQRKGNKDETNLQDRNIIKKEETKTSTEVENQQRPKSSSNDKSANDVESTTMNFNIESRTGDYLDGPFEDLSSVDDKNALENNVERMAFEFELPNDEANSEWDLLDDIISTRRMANTKTVIVAETDKSSDEDTPKSAKNKYEEKTMDSVEKLNIDKDQISKGAKLDKLNTNVVSETPQKKDSQVDEKVKSVIKEKLENDEITKSVNKENRPYEKTPKDSHSLNGDLIIQPLNLGNVRVGSPYVPRVHKPHSHPQLPLDVLRPSTPPYQFHPVIPVNLNTGAKQGIDAKNMRVMPLPYLEQRRLENSREALERSLESIESRNFDDFNYERNSNAYPYTPQRKKNDYIFSKLMEASENAQRPTVGLPLNKLPPKFGGIPNLNTYSYPPIARPLVT